MERICTLFMMLFFVLVAASATAEDGLTLLQVRATALQQPEVCANRPHPEGPTEFGCQGTAKANKLHWCHLWGEPHITATFPKGGNPDNPLNVKDNRRSGHVGDYSMQRQFDSAGPGLFRLARAVDDTWEVQVFSCGLTLAGAAWRFGNSLFEVVVGNRKDPQPHFYVNGVKTTPEQLKGPLRNGGYVAVSERNHERDMTTGIIRRGAHANGTMYALDQRAFGLCADDPKKQVSIDVDAINYGAKFEDGKSDDYNTHWGNVLNILVHAARGSWDETDRELSICDADQNRSRYSVKNLPKEESLFKYTPEDVLCKVCINDNENSQFKGHAIHGSHEDMFKGEKAVCKNSQPEAVPPEEMCPRNNLSLDLANSACEHLKDEPQWFDDCVFDVCMTGDLALARDAENQEAEELPRGKCVDDSADCSPVKVCCDAYDAGILKFEHVVQNNLAGSQDGPRELRYGNVLTGIDLRVTSPGNDYTNRYGNDNNGVNGLLGRINLDVGTVYPFNFSFVKSGTNDLVSPGNVVLSFLDLDQGKKNKQRESVKVCDLGSSPVVSSNTELDVAVTGTCATFTSTTKGNGEDNPDNPEKLADHHKARAVAFPVNGKSSFFVEFGVSVKGKQNRDFLFSGTPTVACED